MKGINSSFTLNLKAIDINLVEYLDINYEIANTNYQRLLKLSMNYKSTKEFQIQIDIPVEYEENVYKLKISAKNEFNKVSDVITFYFNFSYNRPLLNVTNQIKELYYRDTDKYIHISGEVRDIRCIGSIVVSYDIDNKTSNINTTVNLRPECYEAFYLRIPLSHVSDGLRQFSINAINNEKEISNPFMFKTNISLQYIPSNFGEVNKRKVRNKFSLLAAVSSLARK